MPSLTPPAAHLWVGPPTQMPKSRSCNLKPCRLKSSGPLPEFAIKSWGENKIFIKILNNATNNSFFLSYIKDLLSETWCSEVLLQRLTVLAQAPVLPLCVSSITTKNVFIVTHFKIICMLIWSARVHDNTVSIYHDAFDYFFHIVFSSPACPRRNEGTSQFWFAFIYLPSRLFFSRSHPWNIFYSVPVPL